MPKHMFSLLYGVYFDELVIITAVERHAVSDNQLVQGHPEEPCQRIQVIYTRECFATLPLIDAVACHATKEIGYIHDR